MDAFNEFEDDRRSREESLKARELEMRLKEIEYELEGMPSQQASKSTEVKAIEVKAMKAPSSRMRSRTGSFQLSKAARFWFIVVGVIVGIRLLNIVSAAMFVFSVTWLPPLLILGGAWIVYKLFFESDD